MMKIFKFNRIEWYFDPDGDLSSWKSPEQLDEGFRLPTIKELTTLVNYNKNKLPLLTSKAPFSGSAWSQSTFPDKPDLAFCIDFHRGTIYPSTKANRRNLLLVKI